MQLIKKETKSQNDFEDAILELWDLDMDERPTVCRYMISYKWTVKGEPTRVKGSEISYWPKKAVQAVLKGGSLFDSFRLFP